ncbi:MAG: hypothetical protein AAGI34_01550 [Pseudomonadota bacterium]
MYEYKTVGGPERGRKARGCRTASDRAAVAMQEIIAAEAALGWEYLRTDLVPIEDGGLFARRRQIHCAVLVFRRPLHSARPARAPVPQEAGAEGRREPMLLGRAEPAAPGLPVAERPVETPVAARPVQASPVAPLLGSALGRRVDEPRGE